MNVDEPSPRKPWLAGLLQLFIPGMGNLYCGNPGRGLLFFGLGIGTMQLAWAGILILPSVWNVVVAAGIWLAMQIVIVVSAIQCARSAGHGYRRKRYNRWYVYAAILLVVIVIDEAYSREIIPGIGHVYRIPTQSMEPTILSGDSIAVNKVAYWFHSPQRGDLVVFLQSEQPKIPMVKRIIALPSEVIEFRNNSVFINGTQLEEPFAHATSEHAPDDLYSDARSPTRVPDGAYFVLGDSRDNSLDSRHFGSVPANQIFGKVRMVFYSIDPESSSIRWNRIGWIPK